MEKVATNLGVTRSGYYAWLGRGKAARGVEDEQLGDLIKGIQQEVKYRYGSPRMTRELRRRGRQVGHNRVARLMREGQLGARPRKPYRVTTKSNHKHPVAENVLQRQFSVYAFGVTPKQMLTQYRLARAYDLLRADRPVGKVAEACGLDPKHFFAAFKARYGVLPSEVAAQRRETGNA